MAGHNFKLRKQLVRLARREDAEKTAVSKLKHRTIHPGERTKPGSAKKP